MAVSTLKKETPSWEYVGDVYWWENSWTCPADGFIVFTVTPNQSSWYWYVKDSTAPNSWSYCMAGSNANTHSATMFVKQGAVLQTAMISSVRTANAYYYKFV